MDQHEYISYNFCFVCKINKGNSFSKFIERDLVQCVQELHNIHHRS